MAQTDEGARVLPLRSATMEIDEYVMCAVPGLSRAATTHSKETPFRPVHIVPKRNI